MTTYYHLYDPVSDTHYQNGGYIQPDSEAPAEGLEWVVGYPPDGSLPYVSKTDPFKVSQTIKAMVAGLAVTNARVLLTYSGQIGLINDFLNEQNLQGAVALLLGLVEIMANASDNEALGAAQPVIDYLETIGVISDD